MQSSNCTIISNEYLTAVIDYNGAELISLQNSENREYIWEGDPKVWGKHSPVLFPIVGTLKENSYTFNDTVYRLTRHGFARDMEFSLIEKSDDVAAFSLRYSDDTLIVFPFNFELQIIYRLFENKLQIQYHVINHGNTDMPFSLGAHPAFALPGNFGDYSLQFELDESFQYHLLENDLVSQQTAKLELDDNRLPLNYDLFKNDALIFKSLQSGSVTILDSSKPLLKIEFKEFPHLGIWTKENAAFLCIEPWFGYSDTNHATGNLFDKDGIQTVIPEASFSAKFSIEIF